jgi:hypothetical protein
VSQKKLQQFCSAAKSSCAPATHIAAALNTPGRVAFLQTRSVQVTGKLHTFETVLLRTEPIGIAKTFLPVLLAPLELLH